MDPLDRMFGAVEHSDVDTVMVAGEIRRRGGKLVGVDLARLQADMNASRDYLLETSGYHPDLFKTTTAVKTAV
jgi:5-methylthioadenosine/S-adenosylhomocysteine deaminase